MEIGAVGKLFVDREGSWRGGVNKGCNGRGTVRGKGLRYYSLSVKVPGEGER